jgi:SpoVK/Ycf46/Vps4 family AAA+-type ATPase
VSAAYEREANAIVSVLLAELERFPGVVIFATNLAANIDPAFERRIRTHILFEMPNAAERARIWRVQLHARKTPLADDVDFAELAERFPRIGGDIKKAVLKAAQSATTEPGPDHLRSPLILRLVHAGSLTAKQRAVLVESAKGAYGAEQEAHKAAVKTAEDPYAKAVAEFALANAKAVLKLLDSIPTT